MSKNMNDPDRDGHCYFCGQAISDLACDNCGNCDNGEILSKKKVITDQQAFEKWFLRLNSDFSREELTPGRNGSYFYTTTKTLYKQFIEIKRLTSIIDIAHIECSCCGITIIDYTNDTCSNCKANWITGEEDNAM